MLKIFVMLAVVFALLLAACGPSEAPATEEPAMPEEPAAPEPTEAPMPEPTEEPMMPEVDPTGQTISF